MRFCGRIASAIAAKGRANAGTAEEPFGHNRDERQAGTADRRIRDNRD